MKRALLSCRLPAFALAAAYAATSAPASAQATGQAPAPAPGQATGPATGPAGDEDNNRTVAYADVNTSVGYSTNPNLQATTRASSFGRVSITAYHAWRGDRGSTSLSGFVENTTYLRGGYGSKQIFRLNARTNRAISEKLRVFGALAASGDIAGQLSNRFTGPTDTNPPPDTNPDLLNLIGRQYLVNGQVGASVTTGPRSSMSLSAAASHAFFTGANKAAEYTTYQSSLGYSYQLSERTSLGTQVSLQRQDYRGNDYSDVVSAAVTMGTRLAEDISANGSIGLLAIYAHRGGQTDHTYSPSFSASVCKSGERTRYCAAVSRSAQTPLSLGVAQNTRSAAITTNFSLSYSHEIGRKDTFRAQLTGINSSSSRIIDEGKFRTTYVTGLVSYDRKIANRLFGGVSAGARRLFQTGPDPKMDYNGNFYLRYRLGDQI